MNNMLTRHIRIGLLSFLGLSISSYAQTPPDAGTLYQQVKPNEKLTVPSSSPTLKVEENAVAPSSSVKIKVLAFKFSGNTLISSKVLEEALKKDINKTLTFDELQDELRVIAKLYRSQGWFVKAYLPKQDVTEGFITIYIVEAKYGGVRITLPSAKPLVSTRIIERYFQSAQTIGNYLNINELDRALLLVDDLAGASLTGLLEEGTRDAETMLHLEMKNQDRIRGFITADNQGSHGTGDTRGMMGVAIASPLGLGDSLNTAAMQTEGSSYMGVNYSVPIGSDGLHLTANHAPFKYHLTPMEFQALKASGSADSTSIDLSYPIIRSQRRNLYVSLSASNKKFVNEANGFVQSDYKAKGTSITFKGNQQDALFGLASNLSASISYDQGKIDYGTLQFGENPELAGYFNKTRYTLTQTTIITDKFGIATTITGQYANKNLDSSERFSLGGSTGVRAYPSGEGGGSTGQIANLEMRYRIHPQMQASIFYDWGRVVNYDSIAPSYHLAGYGVSLDWSINKTLSVKAQVASRIGSNPNSTPAGKDQDGTFDKTRVWFTVTAVF